MYIIPDNILDIIPDIKIDIITDIIPDTDINSYMYINVFHLEYLLLSQSISSCQFSPKIPQIIHLLLIGSIS